MPVCKIPSTKLVPDNPYLCIFTGIKVLLYRFEDNTVKKKNENGKKKFDVKKAIEETMPLVINYRKVLGELVTKTYNVYMDCQEQEEWEAYCDGIGFDRHTVEGWHRDHNMPSKRFLVNHDFGEPLDEISNEENYINEQIETATDEEQIEILQYKETTHLKPDHP